MKKCKIIEKGSPKMNSIKRIIPFQRDEMDQIRGGGDCSNLVTCTTLKTCGTTGKRNVCTGGFFISCAILHQCDTRYVWQGGTVPIF